MRIAFHCDGSSSWRTPVGIGDQHHGPAESTEVKRSTQAEHDGPFGGASTFYQESRVAPAPLQRRGMIRVDAMIESKIGMYTSAVPCRVAASAR